MAKAKTVNYTTEQTDELVGAYTAASDDSERAQVVAEYAEKFGKKPRSLIAKLSREGVYVARAKVSKVTGEKPVKKDVIAEMMTKEARNAGVVLVSAEKLNKTDAANLLAFFREYNGTETPEVEAAS